MATRAGRLRPAFVGRGAELSRLRTLLTQVEAGVAGAGAVGSVGRVALVSGAAGMGKSRLVEEALATVAGRVTVHRGSAVQGDARAFGPLARALDLVLTAADPECARLAGLIGTYAADRPDGGGRDVDSVHRTVVDGVVGLLRRRAAARPTAVVLEDLQWADPATLAGLAELARRLADEPVVFVATLRPVPPVRPLDRLVDGLVAAGATLLRLRPLDAGEVADLAGTVLTGRPGPRLREHLADCGGSPALVVELLRTLDRPGGLVVAGGVVEVGHAAPAPVLRDAVRERVAQLSPAVGELVYLATVLGESFPLDELATVAERSVPELLPNLNEAIRAGVLGLAGDRLSFQPGLARTALYSGLPAGRRGELHRRAGRALAAAGAPAQRIAVHVAVAATPGDVQAVRWLQAAGVEVARQSVPQGIDLLDRALWMAGPDLPTRAAVAVDLAPLLVLGGRFADADTVITEALSSCPDGPLAARLRAANADAAILTGRLHAALHRLADVPDGRAALALVGLGDLAAARRRADTAVAAAQVAGDEVAGAVAATASAWVAVAHGEYRAAAEVATVAVASAERADAAAAAAQPHLALAAALAEMDRIDEATLLLQDSHRRAERMGADALLPGPLAASAALRLHRGDWDDAVSDADAALRTVERVGTHPGAIAAAVLTRIALARGDLASAGRTLAAAGNDPPDLVAGRAWLRWVDALVREAEGRKDRAAATIRAGWEESASVRHLLAPRLLHRDAVRLALTTGDHAYATVVVEQIEALSSGGEGSLTGVALWCRGLLEEDPELLTRAVHAYCGGPRLVEIAALSEDTGVAFGRIGERREAARFLAVAEKGYTRFGACADLARVRSVLRSVGVGLSRSSRPGRSGRRGRPRFGWDALTDTERVVARLVAEGLSNPKIAERLHISRYTVETHLKRVFVKLDLSSRAALAAEVIRRQSPTP